MKWRKYVTHTVDRADFAPYGVDAVRRSCQKASCGGAVRWIRDGEWAALLHVDEQGGERARLVSPSETEVKELCVALFSWAEQIHQPLPSPVLRLHFAAMMRGER